MKVAVLGFGTIGKGVYAMLQDAPGMEAGPVLVRPGKADAPWKVTDIDDIVNDPSVDAVAEMMGGIEPAFSYASKALSAGKHFVTSNKALVAAHGLELAAVAREKKAAFLFSAACGGGVPFLHNLSLAVKTDKVINLGGILNGTTNYMLDAMQRRSLSYAEALSDAQQLGYAEADPKNDVEGYDAAYKLSILASLAFRCSVSFNDIYREGITRISAEDIRSADRFGYTIKMLAMGINHPDAIELRVHPVMIEKNHPLATVSDAFNAIYIKGESLGESMLYGRGAGELPTASAVVGDVMNLAFRGDTAFSRDTEFALNERKVMTINECFTSFFIRCVVDDAPGVLAKLSNIFANNEVSIQAIQQIDAEAGKATITIVTHRVNEEKMRAALNEIEGLPCVQEVASVIRVGLGDEQL